MRPRKIRLSPTQRAVLGCDPERWRELARVAIAWLADQCPDERMRYVRNRTRVTQPMGQGGEANPCLRLAEEIGLRLDPPPPRFYRPGVDRDALEADNADEIRRLAELVLVRCDGHEAVENAAKSVR
jgi:hypothetical protein